MNRTGDHHVKKSKPESEEQRLLVFPPTWKLNIKDKCIYKYIYGIYIYTHITERVRKRTRF
jgi:hypothetical protein